MVHEGKEHVAPIIGQATHTPGPWEITKSGAIPIHVGAKDGRWKHVPGTLLAEVGGNLSVGTGNFQEDLANARLIAAAPDMLAALKWAATVIRPGSDLHNDMTAAIAKAEGRT